MLDLTRIFSTRFPSAESVRLDRPRVFVFPTRHGAKFGVLLFVMLLASVNYKSSLGLLLTFFLASLSLASILHTYFNLAHLTLRCGRVDPVFAGSTAIYVLSVENGSGRPRHDLQLRGSASRGPEVVTDAPVGLSTVALARPAPARGRQLLGKVVVETQFPLGLFRAWSYLDLGAECLVYPKPAPPRPWRFEGEQEFGESGTRGRGQGDFAGLRAYRPGDPAGQIHWRASTRAETLLVKQFGGVDLDEVWLDWEDLPGLEAEARLSQLCRRVLDAHQSGGVWGLRIPGTEIGVGAGVRQLHRCLTVLADYPP